MPAVPYDIYESPHEIVILLPLGGVSKKSISLGLEDNSLHIHGERIHKKLRDDCICVQQSCYRWAINLTIDLPPHISYSQIHSSLSPDNILTIVVPKNTVPETIPLTIEK